MGDDELCNGVRAENRHKAQTGMLFEVSPGLFVGSRAGALDPEERTQAQLTHVISLVVTPAIPDVVHIEHVLKDNASQRLAEQLKDLLPAIHAALLGGGRV